MPNKNYLRGRAYEYRIKKKWEKEGWTVLRTAGSHGEFDLIAVKTDSIKTAHCDRCQCDYMDSDDLGKEIVLIQAKSGKSAKREKAKLEPLKAKYDGIYSVRVEIV